MAENSKKKNSKANMVSLSQIKIIHTLKSRIGLDDDLYLEMLKSFDVISSKELTMTEAAILIDILINKAVYLNKWHKKKIKYDDLIRGAEMATPAQLRMIEGLWRELVYIDTEKFAKTSLRKFLKSKFKVDDIMFLTKSKATKVITGIKEIKKYLNKKSAATL